MENRYLPILHENISLSVLRVSNEPPSSWGEWAVKMVFNVNSRKLLSCACPVLTGGGELHSIEMTDGWKRFFTRS